MKAHLGHPHVSPGHYQMSPFKLDECVIINYKMESVEEIVEYFRKTIPRLPAFDNPVNANRYILRAMAISAELQHILRP